jgi:hypothetical protein
MRVIESSKFQDERGSKVGSLRLHREMVQYAAAAFRDRLSFSGGESLTSRSPDKQVTNGRLNRDRLNLEVAGEFQGVWIENGGEARTNYAHRT